MSTQEIAAMPRRSHDVVIVGAGPAGLSLALSLSQLGLRVAVAERQEEAAVAEPADDGREIALTHRSLRTLRVLGAAQGWSAEEVSPIRTARVYNGRSARFLDFSPARGGEDGSLGQLVPNHAIRRELYRCARAEPRIELLFGQRLGAVRSGTGLAAVHSESRDWLAAPLLVAADSRFSETRRAMGIGASTHDFGRTMLVLRASHTQPHLDTAMEWFDFGHTIATLPLQGNRSSIILTVPGEEAARLAALAPAALEARLNDWLESRLGRLSLCSPAHRYPLVAVYATRFTGPRFALVGDAAVGMHPVTAHGFNFGLSGQALLASAIAAALRDGRDIGAERVLNHYEHAHRRRTLPLYQATNAIARLYGDGSAPARLLRRFMLGAAERLPPIKQAILRELRS